MSHKPEIAFARSTRPAAGLAVLLAGEGSKFSQSLGAVDPAGVVQKAAKVAGFTGKSLSTLDVLAPADSAADRIVVIGIGDGKPSDPSRWLKLGGAIAGMVKKSTRVTIHLDGPDVPAEAEVAIDVAMGTLLRAYSFDRYKTKKDDNGEDKGDRQARVTIVTPAAAAAKRLFADADAVAEGVTLARDLVNEPANILGPVEFANRIKEITSLGVKVEILNEKDMEKLGMGALLGVGQGSVRPSRMAVMQWSGGKAKEKPVAFVRKGVVFDTGGVSIKPAGGMEDMKGDMGGAAAVVGLMRALAGRKAKANVVGVVGLVENMVDGNAQRPGDIVKSMSGQTIEVLNTDAEGRLVLADALWYCNDRFKPRFMVNLATLTGAIIVALGQR